MTALVGFGCSFSGKFFGGYARDNSKRNYASNAKKSLLCKLNTVKNFKFECADYRDLYPTNALIYCDPPYAGVYRYGEKFDNVEFWGIMKKWAKDNIVLVSEYNGIGKIVLEIESKLDIRTTGDSKRMEKVFRVE
jgi:DNA adenine methylase